MNQIASDYWTLAAAWLEAADKAEDINSTIAYTGQAECALKMAQFAVNNPYLVQGIDEFSPPGPQQQQPAPMEGPRFWGPPK